MKRKKLIFRLFGVLVLAALSLLTAQVPTGKVFGVVTDDEGVPLPGAAVEATSPKLVGKAAAVTDENGVYRLFALTPGVYEIVFSLQGFKTVSRAGITVGIEQSVKLDAVLPPGAIEEEVTVVGQSPLIDVKSTVKGMTLTKQEFEMLPRGRDFDSLVGAVPGVQYEPMLSGISVDGASGAENMFYVDGTDITNPYLGVRGQSVAFEFVDEVQVKASGYQAEYGGSLGGVVHVITRQGGNAFHGDVMGFYSGSKLNGKERDVVRLNPYDINLAEYVNYQDLYGKDQVDRIEAGFNLGGYILKDRLWFFVSVLPVHNTATRHVVFDPSLTAGDYTRKDRFWNLQGKLTSQPFDFLRVGASFVSNSNDYLGDLPPRNGTGNPADPWSEYGYRYPSWTASAYADFALGNNLLFSVRGGTFYQNTTDQLVQPSAPRYVHGGQGISVFSDVPEEYIRPRGWSNMPSYALNVTERKVAQRSHAGGDLTYYMNLAGEHSLKFGAQWVRMAEDWQDGYKFPDYPGHPARLERLLHLPGDQLRPRHLRILCREGKRNHRAHRVLLQGPLRSLGPLPPGQLDDRRPADLEPRPPGGARVHPELQRRSGLARHKADRFRVRGQAGAATGLRLRRGRGREPQDLRELRALFRCHEALYRRRLVRGKQERGRDSTRWIPTNGTRSERTAFIPGPC